MIFLMAALFLDLALSLLRVCGIPICLKKSFYISGNSDSVFIPKHHLLLDVNSKNVWAIMDPSRAETLMMIGSVDTPSPSLFV